MKRWLSLFVAFVMILSLCPTVLAQAPDTPVITCRKDSMVVHVTISAPEGYNMQGQSFYYRIDDGVWVQYSGVLGVQFGSTVYAKTVRTVGDESAVATVVIDKNGNHTVPGAVAVIGQTSSSDVLGLPQIIADTGKWTNQPVSVTISGSDLPIEYRLGTDDQWHSYTGQIGVESSVTVYARYAPLIGTPSEAASLDILNIDLVAPDISAIAFNVTSADEPVTVDSSAFQRYYRGDVAVTMDGAIDGESGIAWLEYQMVSSTESLNESEWKRYDPSAPPAITGEFCGYVYCRALDNAGNHSSCTASTGFVIDRTAPVISGVAQSTTELTDSRVTVSFTVTDNYLLDAVSVNDSYVGLYDPEFTVYRNGEYIITARDKAGNISRSTVNITNINSTPFNMLAMFNSLEEANFTPSSWVVAQAAANELQGMLTVESSEAMISAASEKLLASMEALVVRGDGTASLRLIERVNEYDPEFYTDSSWAHRGVAIDAINLCLDNPERTQEDVDTARQALELAVTELALRGNFTNIDRLIAQGEALDGAKYNTDKFAVFMLALEAARSLSRTDSTQTEVDGAYSLLLDSMNGLKELPVEEKEFPLVSFVIVGVLIIAVGTALFILNRRIKRFAPPVADQAETPDETQPKIRSVGDICFTDEDDKD